MAINKRSTVYRIEHLSHFHKDEICTNSSVNNKLLFGNLISGSFVTVQLLLYKGYRFNNSFSMKQFNGCLHLEIE